MDELRNAGYALLAAAEQMNLLEQRVEYLESESIKEKDRTHEFFAKLKGLIEQYES